MDHLPGEVYFDPDFQFKDGEVGEKLFVVLCDSPWDTEVVTVAKTTSVHKPPHIYGNDSSNRTNGCSNAALQPNFYLSPKEGCFKLGTWILLEEVYEYQQTVFENGWRELFTLDMATTQQILNCAAGSEFIPIGIQNELIRLAAKLD